MRRLAVLFALFLVAVGAQHSPAQARPVTIVVGEPHTPSIVYGPADMLCDLNTCRLFNLPKDAGLPQGAIVEFGLPKMDGQGRLDIRRCFQICHASILGFERQIETPPEHGNPTVAITPIELRLQ